MEKSSLALIYYDRHMWVCVLSTDHCYWKVSMFQITILWTPRNQMPSARFYNPPSSLPPWRFAQWSMTFDAAVASSCLRLRRLRPLMWPSCYSVSLTLIPLLSLKPVSFQDLTDRNNFEINSYSNVHSPKPFILIDNWNFLVFLNVFYVKNFTVLNILLVFYVDSFSIAYSPCSPVYRYFNTTI